MFQRNPKLAQSRRVGAIVACVVAGAALGTTMAACGGSDDEEPSSASPAPVTDETQAPVTTITPEQAIEDEAVTTAIKFMEARDHWDGEAARALVADDAVIADFGMATAEEYLVNAEFERIIEWRYLEPACAATDVNAPAEVTCTYLMQDALSVALDAGPYTGSSMKLVIEDGQIRNVTHDFDFSQYSDETFAVFTGWLADANPGDIDIMFVPTGDGGLVRSTTPESLALWTQRVPEFVASSSNA